MLLSLMEFSGLFFSFGVGFEQMRFVDGLIAHFVLCHTSPFWFLLSDLSHEIVKFPEIGSMTHSDIMLNF
jgi:hypothetical protein